MKHLPACLTLLSFLLVRAASAQGQATAIAAVLDDFHEAASQADGTRYFNHFAEDAVFLGTDITERWTVDAFKAYATPYFDQGRGWTYMPRERFIYVSDDARTAWFDETLHNERFGACRGTGVLVRHGDTWKIAQYHLTIPIPNDLVFRVVDLIQADKP